MRKVGIVLVFCVGVLFFATEMLLPGEAAQESPPKGKVEQFLSTIKSGEVSVAYDKLFEGSSIAADKPQAVTLVKQQTGMLKMYGKILGYEPLLEERFGSSLVRLVYLLKMEKHAITWEFYFYKPKDSWFLINVVFNDQFQLLSAKK